MRLFRGIVLSAALAMTLGSLAAAVPASATTAGGTQLWLARYHATGENNSDEAGLAVSPDGTTAFVTGTVRYPSSTHRGSDIDNAATGAQVWSASYAGPSGRDAAAVAIGVSPDGSTAFVTGTLATANGFHAGFIYGSGAGAATASFDSVDLDASTGALLWAAKYLGPAGGNASTVVANPAGGSVIVAGTSTYGSKAKGYTSACATLAYSTAG